MVNPLKIIASGIPSLTVERASPMKPHQDAIKSWGFFTLYMWNEAARGSGGYKATVG